MEIVTLIPGATTLGDPITITAGAPDIDAVIAAEILRMPTALAAHPAAAIVAALNNHTGANILAAIDVHTDVEILGAVADHSAVLLAAAFGNHTQAEVVNAIAEHAVHAHEIEVGGAGAPADPYGAVLAGTAHICAAAANLLPPAGVTGIQNYTTPAHGVGVGPIVHGVGVDLPHAEGGAAVGHTAGGPVVHGASAVDVAHVAASPVQAATPAKSTTRRITLNVDTLLGDVLTLFYLAVGERVPAS